MAASHLKIDPTPASDAASEHLRRMLDVEPQPRHRAILPVLITLIAVLLAAPLTWAMWYAYMEGPWTRDGTVRAYVDQLAPEVAGIIVALPVHDNQYVHKGQLLMVIDPRDYEIAVKLAQAVVQQDQADLVNLQREAARRQNLSNQAVPVEQKQSADTAVLVAEATLQQAQVQLDLAQINLERTQIRSPANGWVTHLEAQLGDYAKVGASQLAVVDADSYWVDGYFEETSLHAIQVGDPAKVKLLGYRQVLSGHVASIARAIGVPNAQPNRLGLATVNPIFTWVRLAQRVPVRIQLDHVPPGIQLVAGMTTTVEVDPPASKKVAAF
ncbi:biotin/lipoyl-binding protein [Acidocella sp.]|jgi:multidrug resistance efflux pump|uniref:HlyD family efflux transporter periplasmic adaptor subunit n=1 Tax=Acidocella sp. TaxID=50710 RepID=UPI002F420A3B